MHTFNGAGVVVVGGGGSVGNVSGGGEPKRLRRGANGDTVVVEPGSTPTGIFILVLYVGSGVGGTGPGCCRKNCVSGWGDLVCNGYIMIIGP